MVRTSASSLRSASVARHVRPAMGPRNADPIARMNLRPSPHISADALAAGKRALVMDAAWASATGALSGGVVLVAFALTLGAGPLEVGLLAAIPFIAQIAQLPGIALVERIRQRKKMGVIAVTLARVLILGLALLPALPMRELQLPLLVLAQLFISLLGSAAACAINSWFHQLLPAERLGAFFARRLLVASVVACVSILSVGLLVDFLPSDARLNPYSLVFAAAGIAGLASSYYLARTPEPTMPMSTPGGSLWGMLRGPFRDPNFAPLLVLLGAWNLAANLAAPFLTVYLIQQLNYGLSTVTTLWVTSQLANAFTLYIWGRLSDRMSNKAVLAVAFPIYFACTLGLVFAAPGSSGGMRLGYLYVLHIVMGAASGGISLATGNLGLKLAPKEQGTAYLASIGMVAALAGGTAPLAGGVLAEWFASSELSVVLRWSSVAQTKEVSVLSFAHWEFLFAISALLGLYVMHALSRIKEGNEYSERAVIQELAFEALRTVNHLSSIGGVLGSVFPFERLSRGLYQRLPRSRRLARVALQRRAARAAKARRSTVRKPE